MQFYGILQHTDSMADPNTNNTLIVLVTFRRREPMGTALPLRVIGSKINGLFSEKRGSLQSAALHSV